MLGEKSPSSPLFKRCFFFPPARQTLSRDWLVWSLFFFSGKKDEFFFSVEETCYHPLGTLSLHRGGGGTWRFSNLSTLHFYPLFPPSSSLHYFFPLPPPPIICAKICAICGIHFGSRDKRELRKKKKKNHKVQE